MATWMASVVSTGMGSCPLLKLSYGREAFPPPHGRAHPFTPSIKAGRRRNSNVCAMYVDDDQDEGYLLDAPTDVGDGFSFCGGKYSNVVGRAEEWFGRGKMVEAYPIDNGSTKAKDPIFGLAMGAASQISGDSFRWFCVEEGNPENPTILLLHGFPSQAYSYRSVMPILSPDFHVVAFDWLGFGFSDIPQPKFGFNYTPEEYVMALSFLVESLGVKKLSIVAQGYFAPLAVKYANMNDEKVDRLILLNPPITEQHGKLPSTLSCFANFLFGEIFAQDPIKASDTPLTSCGPYALDEEDAMVYRRPYLASGSAGFALNAISRAWNKDLKEMINELQKTLSSSKWNRRTSVIWGMKDRWLSFKGVAEFAAAAKVNIVQLAEVGHHAQDDFPEEVGAAIKRALKSYVL